ncbi:MAG: UpxY family transcription antiterminator [Bacteroidetes bacterium]|jgi:transcription antitermination factor NusG|nr:UpxY family transcription antiterminator [Bacteroidota bacterium]
MRKLHNTRSQLVRDEPRWFALYTRFKREKQILSRLQEKGVKAYLPLQKLTRRYGNRIRHVELPLISCYIFTKITLQEYVTVLRTENVVDFVKFSNTMIAIPEREIRLLQQVVDGGYEVEVQPAAYQAGDKVEIVGGSLTGTTGTFVKRRDKKNFVVDLSGIGYALRIAVPPELIRKVDQSGIPAAGR